MEKLFEKLGDLKSFFIYGQKLIPTLQKILNFMQDTVPLLESVNKSIAESTSKIPKATNQLHSVSNATELATTEILDLVDGISNELNSIFSKTSELKNRLQKQKELAEKLKSKYQNDNEIDEFLSYSLFDDELCFVDASSNKIQESIMNITIALQVQDITAQQLASVNHLINSIQEKLSGLLLDLNGKERESDKSSSQHESITFNENARYVKDNQSQKLADSLVAQTNGVKSQKEIDQLFSNKNE
ncbi:MAG: protein phosphatase CheZ [Stygiobacter sp.]|uniref:Protein phosphatase CheZ n=1 Tax=Stygiobacter electus TaxID=3032292 RepID=A0AAE3P1G0_9BACT|nr:protein phosphatase CheZ [Stygiobacter electus]MDF1611273.1 protein phosphatase CheZ [Stygiobacter electus]